MKPQSKRGVIRFPTVRRYLIYGLLAVVWCCIWIMVGLILYLV
jgi:hypothetical protein